MLLLQLLVLRCVREHVLVQVEDRLVVLLNQLFLSVELNLQLLNGLCHLERIPKMHITT